MTRCAMEVAVSSGPRNVRPQAALRGVRRGAWIAVVACGAWWSGCAREDPFARFVPSAAEAEAALTAVMDAWKAGVPPGLVPDASPPVHVTDAHRRAAETLVAFDILGEVPGDTPRCYAVRLQFDPPREEKARYVVVGIDPLWVFRLEDYQLLAHWEHRMEDVGPQARASAGGEDATAAERSPVVPQGSSAP